MTAAPIEQTAGELRLTVLRQFRLIFGSMRAYFRQLEALTGLSSTRLWILQEVAQSPGISINEVARLMGVHQSTCSITAEKLVAEGFLHKNRDSADQRKFGLFLSQAGRDILGRLPGPAEGILPVALAKLPDPVVKTLIINMNELITALPLADRRFASYTLADLLAQESRLDVSTDV